MRPVLTDNEWLFDSCPSDEWEACLRYEYSRELVLHPDIGTPKLGWQIWHAEDTSKAAMSPIAIPTRDDKPWLDLAEWQRRKFMRHYGIPWGGITAVERADLDPPSIESLVRGLMMEGFDYPQSRVDHEDRTFFVAEIYWGIDDDKILEQFRYWLVLNRPDKMPDHRFSVPHAPTAPREKLKALGALRVMRHVGGDWTEASKFTKRVEPGTGATRRLYESDRGWQGVTKRAMTFLRQMVVIGEI